MGGADSKVEGRKAVVVAGSSIPRSEAQYRRRIGSSVREQRVVAAAKRSAVAHTAVEAYSSREALLLSVRYQPTGAGTVLRTARSGYCANWYCREWYRALRSAPAATSTSIAAAHSTIRYVSTAHGIAPERGERRGEKSEERRGRERKREEESERERKREEESEEEGRGGGSRRRSGVASSSSEERHKASTRQAEEEEQAREEEEEEAAAEEEEEERKRGRRRRRRRRT
eukprot:2190434-Rhodomonas_salina.1